MNRSGQFIVRSLLGGAVAVGVAGVVAPMFHPASAVAADTKAPATPAPKDKPKDKEHMTRADRVRDALDHLKQAKEQLDTANVDEKGHDAAAFLKCKEAITECEKYLEQVDAGKPAQ